MNENSRGTATDTAKSVHLSASAGSGKTRALKDRYLALLDQLQNSGLHTDQAVAITFTEKAAAEIKERVMRDLPEAMLKNVLRSRQDLRISTIHSFCMNLLKRYPLEAGLPPDFGVLDARDQAYTIQKAIEDALEESDRDTALMAPLKHFTADELVSRLKFLVSIRSKLKRIEIDAGGPDTLIAALGCGMRIEPAEADLKSLVAGRNWRSRFKEMERILLSQPEFYDECGGKEHARLSSVNDVASAVSAAAALAPIYFNKDGSPCKKVYLSKGRFASPSRREYENNFFEVQTMLQQVRALHSLIRAGREAESLLKLFHVAEAKYQTSKLRQGLLDFDDLEIFTYRLLQRIESVDILYWLDHKILHFLLDEFQDTSDIQWAILQKLTEEIFAGQGAEKRAQPTLFVVGDEKQSIYRFREANYRLIDDVRQKMETNLPPESREILTLDRNFRSTPEIIQTVNQVFSSLWEEAYSCAAAERGDHKGSVRLIELDPSQTVTEGEIVAREIRSMISAGTIVYERAANPGGSAQYPEPRALERGDHKPASPAAEDSAGNSHPGWTERNAGYGDCAILIQSRTKLKEFEAALQIENVPYRVIGGIGFYEEEEILSLVNVLFFLWNRDDKLSLAAALRSPLFGFSEPDIFDLLQDDAHILDACQRIRPDVAALFREWTELCGLIPLSGLMHRIVNQTGAYIRFGRINPQAVYNIDKLLDMCREFDRRGYTNLQDFVEWVKNAKSSEQRESTADMNLPGFEGSVSIMTVHKAKGLEYPVVFLPCLNQSPWSLTVRPPAIVQNTGGSVRMAVKDGENPVYGELWEREHDELMREHQRLLYVAMTRARDHLVMTSTLSNGKFNVKANTWLAYLHKASPDPLFGTPVTIAPGITAYTYPAASRVPDAAGTVSLNVKSQKTVLPVENRKERGVKRAYLEEPDIKRIIDNVSPVKRSETALWKKATDFIDSQKEERRESFISIDTRTVSALVRGSILHRCLEEFVKTGSYDLDRIISGYPELGEVNETVLGAFAGDVHGVTALVLNDPRNSWIFERHAESFSELPFLYTKGAALVSGVIDRVVVKEGKALVVDYKSIRVDDDSLAAWTDHYTPQINIYCEAAKHIFSVKNVEGYLLFLDSNKLQLCTRLE